MVYKLTKGGDIMAECYWGICTKCMAAKLIVVGLVLIINQLYFGWDVWIVIGVLIVLKGVLKLVKPTCPHCEEPPKKGKK